MLSEILRPFKPITKAGKELLGQKADEILITKSTGGREPWKTLARIRKYLKDSQQNQNQT